MENFGKISLESMHQEEMLKNLHDTFERRKKIHQPKIDEFEGLPGYSIETLQKEKDKVEQLKTKWSEGSSSYLEKNKQISDVFEGIMVEQLSGAWLGGKGEASYSSEADDFLRHVDCIVEFHPEEGKLDRNYLGLGVDVTFSEDYSNVLSKMDTIWDADVKKGHRTEVQYVETSNFKGKLPMHRVVLAGDKKTVLELARLYKDKKMNALNSHPYLASMIAQIKIQLESYYTYTQKRNLSGEALRDITETLRNFYNVYTIHEDFYNKNQEYLKTDKQFELVREYCENKLGEKIQ
jgi:hypothetical protein